MVCKDEVFMWFKNNEPHHRLELLCGLINMCLPFELKFISTCVEDLGKRDFHDLREAEFKANNPEEIHNLSKTPDERTRSKLIMIIALLSGTNHNISTILYKILVEDHHQRSPGTSEINHVKEMLLIYTMVLHHPAFTFEQKRIIAEFYVATKRRLQEAQVLLHQKEREETCESGVSVGTETEETPSETSGLLPTPVAQLHHFHEPHEHGLETSVGSHVTSPLVGESGGSQDACSSGSGESGELYNDGGTVPTTYIYNSSIFDVALSSDLLTVAPGYQCNHPGTFHYYHQYPQVMGASPGSVSGGRGPISEGSSSEDNGAGVASSNRPPTTTSPFSSPQSSPYVSPLQSLSPSRASSPWSRLNTTTTTTTTTTTATLPHVTSSTSVSSVSSTHSSPQLLHKIPAVGSQASEANQCCSNTVSTQSAAVTSQAHRGKPPASGSRTQRQGDRSGSRTRISGTPIIDANATPTNQNQNIHSPSAARSVSANCGHSKNSSSRWPASPSPVAVSTSSTTSSMKNTTRQSSQSPSLNCGISTCRIPSASVVTTSSSGCKSNHVNSQEGSGVTSTLISSSAVANMRNTVSQGGGGSLDKNVHSISNPSVARPSSTNIEGSGTAYKSTSDNSVVNNNNCLNFELCKHERLNKYFRMLSAYTIDELMHISDHELLERGITKGALAKVRRLLAGLETSNHRPNGFSNPPTTSHPQSSHHSHHIPYNLSYGSSAHNHTTASVVSSSSPSPQASVDYPSPCGTPNHTNPKTSGGVDEPQNTPTVSPKITQVPPQNTVQVYPLDSSSGNCSKTSLPVSVSQSVSHKTSLPYSQSSNATSTATVTNASPLVSDSELLGVNTTACSVSPADPSNMATTSTTTVSLSTATTTTANITTTTNVTQCHAYSVSPSQKISLSGGMATPNTSSTSTLNTNNQGSHSSNSTHNTSSSSQPLNSVPTSVPPSNGVPHYMTTPPPPIHHKTPPLPPVPHRTPPPPLGTVPPRTPSRENSTSSTSSGFMPPTSGTQHMYYTSSSNSGCKANASISASTSSGSGNHTLANNVTLPVYTSSGSISVPPPSNGGLLPMVPPGGQYHHHPAYLYPFLGGGAPGSHTYVPPAAYAAQHPRPLYIPTIGPFAQMKPVPPQSGAPIISGSSSRGGSSSSSCSSSCSSSSSNRGFKKGNQRNCPTKVASHSSDSSPSSSRYSSPPQTPSPDHTRDSANADKRGKGHSDAGETGEGGDSLTLLGSGASEDGTPPPLQPPPLPFMPAPAPLPRHRYMPYQHLAVWAAPQTGMIRYPGLSLPAQGPGVAPRNPVPLNCDKSSRETTPPTPVSMSMVPQDPQCCVRTPGDGSAVPTTSNGSGIHCRNGGSPHAAAPHPEGSLPPPAHNPVPSVASASAGQIPPGNSCAGAPHSSVQYNATGYPMFMGAHMFQHFHSFVPSHSSALTNGFVPPSITPNFAFPTMGNGMNAEFMYGGQYPLMGGSSQSSGGGPAPACGTPTGSIGPSSTGSGLTASLPYPHFPPTLPHTHNPSAGAKKTCYNCGRGGHRGAECKEASIEEMCKRTKDRLV